ncbi:MAG: permease [Acholeplasmataceae bacterium]
MADLFALIFGLLTEGLLFLRDYLFFPQDKETFSLLRILSLFIAFSISGAIVVFMSKKAILKHMGPKANRLKAYGVASVSGVILAVCSCSVLPMFASIRKKGAGLGPAIAFLFSGPAINVLALSLTFSTIGVDIALARVIGSIVLALVIGYAMHRIYRKSEQVRADENVFARYQEEEIPQKPWQVALFFLTLFGILVFGVYEPLPTVILAVVLVVELALFFNFDDIRAWGRETFSLAKRIFPLFIVGVFFAGILDALVTPRMLADLVGTNGYPQNLLASLTGSLMYFATLTEVPIVSALLENGMHRGPATALLLAGPSLSLPNMVVITRVIGIKRAMTYIGLVVMLSALVGMVAGFLFIL